MNRPTTPPEHQDIAHEYTQSSDATFTELLAEKFDDSSEFMFSQHGQKVYLTLAQAIEICEHYVGKGQPPEMLLAMLEGMNAEATRISAIAAESAEGAARLEKIKARSGQIVTEYMVSLKG